MNILFLSNWYPTADSPINGIYVREHARAIASAGNKVIVLAVDITSKVSELTQPVTVIPMDEFGVETHIIHIRSRFWKWIYSIPGFSYRYYRNYFNSALVSKFDPDIIHSNVLYPCAIAGHRLAKELKKKHVITEHWSGVENFMKKNPFRRSGMKAYQQAFAITCVSDFLKEKISKYVPDTRKIMIVPNIIDNTIFTYREKKSTDAIVFTAIASWNRYKLPHLFTEALERISKVSPKKIILNFIGEGEFLENIKRKKWSFTVYYQGNLGRPQVATMLHDSDFFLHASQIETFSIVTAEALLTGTPVIASRVGAIPELVNEKNGVITGNTIEEWQNAIANAFSSRFNNKLISEEMGSRFTSHTIGNKFNEVFELKDK